MIRSDTKYISYLFLRILTVLQSLILGLAREVTVRLHAPSVIGSILPYVSISIIPEGSVFH